MDQSGHMYAAPMPKSNEWDWDGTSPRYVPVVLPSAAPPPGIVDVVLARLANARNERATLDAEIETLEKMLRAVGVET
jgi:hypothetical protein